MSKIISTFTEADVPDQTGKVFVVTGANTGIGYEATRVLASKGARVLLACRDELKGEAASQRILGLHPKADLSVLPYDQADLDSIRRTVDLLQREPRIDVLVNNAGVMTPPLMRTEQGFELQFGVNHLGCFALTGLLLPKLTEAGEARVVITSSIAHKTGKLDWDDLNAEKSYKRGERYNASKLGNALFLYELDRRLRAAGSSVKAVGCHPGIAMTDLPRHIFGGSVLKVLLGPIFNTPAMGAWPTLQASTGEAASGDYFGPQGFKDMRGRSGPAQRAPQATDPALARRLWDVSVEMTGVDPNLAPAP